MIWVNICMDRYVDVRFGLFFVYICIPPIVCDIFKRSLKSKSTSRKAGYKVKDGNYETNIKHGGKE